MQEQHASPDADAPAGAPSASKTAQSTTATSDCAEVRPPPAALPQTTPWPAPYMPSTPQSSHHAAHMQRVPTSFSTSVHGESSDSANPSDLVMKRQQQLAGLAAVHAADPSTAARAGMIAKLRFDIQRQERKRP
eukprot:4589018-Pleurochrysis_carterae.AAC.3